MIGIVIKKLLKEINHIKNQLYVFIVKINIGRIVIRKNNNKRDKSLSQVKLYLIKFYTYFSHIT